MLLTRFLAAFLARCCSIKRWVLKDSTMAGTERRWGAREGWADVTGYKGADVLRARPRCFLIMVALLIVLSSAWALISNSEAMGTFHLRFIAQRWLLWALFGEEAGVCLTASAASQVTQVSQVKSFCSVEANKKNMFHYLFKKINCRLLYLTDQYTYIRPQISACRSVVHIQILHDSLYWWKQAR